MARRLVDSETAKRTVATLKAKTEVIEQIAGMINDANSRIEWLNDHIKNELEKPEEERNQWDLDYWHKDLDTETAKIEVVTDIIDMICK